MLRPVRFAFVLASRRFALAFTRFALAFMGFALAFMGFAHAQPSGSSEAVDPSVTLSTTARGYDQLVQAWRLRRVALEDKDDERADELAERVLRLQGQTGIRRLDAFAVALLREARVAAEAEDWDRVERCLAEAERLSPGLPEVWEVRGALALARQPIALHRWLDGRIRALRARLSDFQRRTLLASDVLLTVLLVMSVLGVLTALGQLGRYGLNIYQDLAQAFPSVMRFVLIAAATLLLLVPLLFGFGPVLFFFPLVMLLWPYQQRNERVLSVVFTLLLGVAPWALRVGDRLTEAGTGIAEVLHSLSVNAADARALDAAGAWLVAHPDDWQVQAVAGLTEKRLGRLDAALPLLEKAAAAAPTGGEAGTVQNNLGNAWFASGRPKAAEAAYRAAIRQTPGEPAPYFNLHRLYQRTGRPQQAAEPLQSASKLDPRRVAAWTEDDDPSANRFVVDMDLPASSLTRRTVTDLLAPTDLATRGWLTLAGPVPEMAAPVGAVVTLLVCLTLALMRKRLRLTWPCGRCGRPAPVDLVAGPPERPLCGQCENLFVKNVPVDRRVRFEKEEAIARYASLRRWATRVAGVAMPGLVGLVRGEPLRGALWAALTLVVGLRLLLPEGLLIDPVRLPDGGTAVGTWLTAALLLALWVYAAVRAFRWPEAHG